MENITISKLVEIATNERFVTKERNNILEIKTASGKLSKNSEEDYLISAALLIAYGKVLNAIKIDEIRNSLSARANQTFSDFVAEKIYNNLLSVTTIKKLSISEEKLKRQIKSDFYTTANDESPNGEYFVYQPEEIANFLKDDKLSEDQLLSVFDLSCNQAYNGFVAGYLAGYADREKLPGKCEMIKRGLL